MTQSPTRQQKVVFVDPTPKARVDRISEGFPSGTVVVAAETGKDDELKGLLADADVLILGGRSVSKQLLDLAPKARYVYRAGAGWDNVDIAAAKERGVLVGNSGGSSAAPVAEHSIMLMLALLRRLPVAMDGMRAGKWPRAELTGTGDLDSATVGIVGAGSIGQAVAQRLKGFGSKTRYNNRRRLAPEVEQRLGMEYLPLDDLLSTSNIVTVHMPLNDQTKKFFNAQRFAQMPQGALFINTAKGDLMDEPALLKSLQDGHLGGAGLDVLEVEKEGDNPLYHLPNVVVTPHAGGASKVGAERGTQAIADNVAQFLRGEVPVGIIPELRE